MDKIAILIAVVLLGLFVIFFVNYKKEETHRTLVSQLISAIGINICVFILIIIATYYEVYIIQEFLVIEFFVTLMVTYDSNRCYKLYLEEERERKRLFSAIDMDVVAIVVKEE